MNVDSDLSEIHNRKQNEEDDSEYQTYLQLLSNKKKPNKRELPAF